MANTTCGTGTRLLEQEVDDDFDANSLTLAEVFVAPARDNQLNILLTTLRDLEVEEFPFPAATAIMLARLRVETGLKMPDCCVLPAAEPISARVATFDDRLRGSADRRNVKTLGL